MACGRSDLGWALLQAWLVSQIGSLLSTSLVHPHPRACPQEQSEPLFLPHPTVGLERPTQLGLEVAWEMGGGGRLAGMTRLFRVELSVCLGSVSFSSKTLTHLGRPCPVPGVRPPANPSPEDTLRAQAPPSSHSLLGVRILTHLPQLGCGGRAPALLGGCPEALGQSWGQGVRRVCLQLDSPLGGTAAIRSLLAKLLF